jgi:hypothetical protein
MMRAACPYLACQLWCGDPLTAVKGDEVIPYLLLANGHDGQLMVHVKFTPVRVVCQNTLAMALHRTDVLPHMALRHDRTLRRRLASSGTQFGDVQRTIKSAADLWHRMAGRKMATRNAEEYVRFVFGGSTAKDENTDDMPDEQVPLRLGGGRDETSERTQGRRYGGFRLGSESDVENQWHTVGRVQCRRLGDRLQASQHSRSRGRPLPC